MKAKQFIWLEMLILKIKASTIIVHKFFVLHGCEVNRQQTSCLVLELSLKSDWLWYDIPLRGETHCTHQCIESIGHTNIPWILAIYPRTGVNQLSGICNKLARIWQICILLLASFWCSSTETQKRTWMNLEKTLFPITLVYDLLNKPFSWTIWSSLS